LRNRALSIESAFGPNVSAFLTWAGTPYLRIEWPQRLDLAGIALNPVRRLEVLVIARSPQAAFGVDCLGGAHPPRKDAGSIHSVVHVASPRMLRISLSDLRLDVARKLLENRSAP
jgi:hypothetical protein